MNGVPLARRARAMYAERPSSLELPWRDAPHAKVPPRDALDEGTMPLAMTESQESPVLLAVSELLGREVAAVDLLQAIVDRIAAALLADRGTLYLVDPATGEVFSKAAHLPELPEIRLGRGQGVAGHVAATGEVVNVRAAGTDGRFFAGVDEKTGYKTESMLVAPIRSRAGTVVGVLQLLNKRGGAFDAADEAYLAKLAAQAAVALEATTLWAELHRPASEVKGPVPLADRFNRIVGESEAMQQVYRLVTKVARSEATVLLCGESGTGKELFARALHVNSARRAGPFVKVDCAALPPSLIENELFGHEKGAYTGADGRAEGKFDAAKGGTLFLDELGELPLPVQGKLLGVLQDRRFTRVGGQKEQETDVRIVAATNRELPAMVKAGTFRADLYYRVRVVELRLPPLRERRGDVPKLARHFLQTAARRHGRPLPTLSEGALDRLARWSWPGNVRELENVLESAVVLADGDRLEAAHLPLPESDEAEVPQVMRPALSPPRPASGIFTIPQPAHVRPLADVERDAVLAALDAALGNRTVAAKWLGIGRNTLGRKLKEWGLAEGEDEPG